MFYCFAQYVEVLYETFAQNACLYIKRSVCMEWFTENKLLFIAFKVIDRNRLQQFETDNYGKEMKKKNEK